MKNSGGRDTFLLFIVLLLALGAVCYLCVIKKNFDKLNDVKDELKQVEQEKAQKDAIIAQAEALNEQSKQLKGQLKTLENKMLPELVTGSIQRNLYKQFEDAGCDALELNMAIMPFETSLSTDDVERTFGNIVQSLKKSVNIPISIKVGTYVTDLAKFMQQLSWTGIQGITMFNKSMQIDVDVEAERLCNADSLTYPGELYNTLRWTAILSRRLRCNLCATTGVSDGLDVAKLLLAGANAVQVASCLYRNGLDYMRTLNDQLKEWMGRKGYESVDQFRGKLAMKTGDKASMLMRTQFMNYFAEIR